MLFFYRLTGMIAWFGVVISGFMVDWLGWASITLPTFAINSSRVVTSTKIFIENGSIATVKGILFSISMTIMINLKIFSLLKSF